MNERFNKRSNRKIDWEKVKKQSGTISIIILVFVLVIFSATYYVVTNHNKIRETVSKNSETAAAKVIFISSGKGTHNAKYEFNVNGKRNTGSTFNTYKGVVGDQICVKYSIQNPGINLYCNDDEMQSVFNDVILFTLKIFALFLVFLSLAFGWLILTKNKKFLIENTSRINNSRSLSKTSVGRSTRPHR